MTPSAFASELQRIEQAVSNGAPGQVPDVALPAAWTIEAGDQRIDVPSTSLRQKLESARRNPATWPAQRAGVIDQLRALQGETRDLDARASVRRSPAPSAARDALDTVLSASEFKRLRQQSAFSRLRQRFSEWLIHIWERLGGAALGRRGAATAFAWIAALAALIVLSFAVVRLILRPAAQRRFAPQPAARRQSARAWARAAMNAADPREAMRCAYSATIYGLEEEGVWSSDDTRTPREYLRLLPADHRRRRLVSEMTRRFEEIWYAAREATETDRSAVLAGLKELGCLPVD